MKKLLLLFTIISHFAFGQNNAPQYNSTTKKTTQYTGVVPKAPVWSATDSMNTKSPIYKFETGRVKFKNLATTTDTALYPNVLVVSGDSLAKMSRSYFGGGGGSSAIDTTKVGRIEQGRGTAPIFMYFNGVAWVRNDTSYVAQTGTNKFSGNFLSNQSFLQVGLNSTNNTLTFIDEVFTGIKSASATSETQISAYSTANGYADISVYNPLGGLYDRRMVITGTGNNTPDQSFRIQNGLLYYFGNYTTYMTDDRTVPDIGKVKQLISDSLSSGGGGSAVIDTTKVGRVEQGRGSLPASLSFDGVKWYMNDTAYAPLDDATRSFKNTWSAKNIYSQNYSTYFPLLITTENQSLSVQTIQGLNKLNALFLNQTNPLDNGFYGWNGASWVKFTFPLGKWQNETDFLYNTIFIAQEGDYSSQAFVFNNYIGDRSSRNISASGEFDISQIIGGQSDTLADGNIWIGDGTDTAFPRTLSGDVTVSNLGVTTIANGTVTTAKIADDAVDLQTKVTGLLPNRNLTDSVTKNLPELGRIITDNWTSTSNWTKVGSNTFTVSGGKLSVVGGTPPAPDFSNYYYNSNYGRTMYMYWTQSFPVTVGTINATSHGVSFGIQSTVLSASSAAVMIGLNSTNKGRVYLYSGSTLLLRDSSSSKITVNSGDILNVTITRRYSLIDMTVTNTSLASSVSGASISYSFSATPNTGYFAIYGTGGTHEIGTYAIDCNHKVGSDLLLVGDSRAFGYGANNAQCNNITANISNLSYTTCDVLAGGGNRNQDIVFSEILALQPKKILLLSGTNNISSGQSAFTSIGYLSSGFSTLTGYTKGATEKGIFFYDDLPCGSYNMTNYSDSIKILLGTTGCIYSFESMKQTGSTSPISSYNLPDLLHPNNNGYTKIAHWTVNQLGLEKRNSPKEIISSPYYANNTLNIQGRTSINPFLGGFSLKNTSVSTSSSPYFSVTSNASLSDVTIPAVFVSTFPGGAGLYFSNSNGTDQITRNYIGCTPVSNVSGSESAYMSFGASIAGTPTEKMRLSSSGNFGVGGAFDATNLLEVQGSTPQFKISRNTSLYRSTYLKPSGGLVDSLVGGTQYVKLTSFNNFGGLTVKNTSTGASSVTVINCNNDNNSGISLLSYGSNYPTVSTIEAANAALLTTQSSKLSIGTNNATGTIKMYTGGIGDAYVRMKIDSIGNVGIGVATPHSTLNVNGSLALGYVAKTATYTATSSDYLINCTANTFTVTLPTAVGIAGRIYEIVNSGGGVITIATTSSQTFTNVTATPITLTLASALGKSIRVMSNGANWVQLN